MEYTHCVDDKILTTRALFDETGDFFIYSEDDDDICIVIDPELTPALRQEVGNIYSHGQDILTVIKECGVYTHAEAIKMGNCTNRWVLDEGEGYNLVYKQEVTNENNTCTITSSLKAVDPSDYYYCYYNIPNHYSITQYSDGSICEYQSFMTDNLGPFFKDSTYSFQNADGQKLFSLEETYDHSDGQEFIDSIILSDADGNVLLYGDDCGFFSCHDTFAITAELLNDGYVGATREFQETYQFGPDATVTCDLTYTWGRDAYDMDDELIVRVCFSYNGEQFYSAVVEGMVLTP